MNLAKKQPAIPRSCDGLVKIRCGQIIFCHLFYINSLLWQSHYPIINNQRLIIKLVHYICWDCINWLCPNNESGLQIWDVLKNNSGLFIREYISISHKPLLALTPTPTPPAQCTPPPRFVSFFLFCQYMFFLC